MAAAAVAALVMLAAVASVAVREVATAGAEAAAAMTSTRVGASRPVSVGEIVFLLTVSERVAQRGWDFHACAVVMRTAVVQLLPPLPRAP